jgi:hypothetical protein
LVVRGELVVRLGPREPEPFLSLGTIRVGAEEDNSVPVEIRGVSKIDRRLAAVSVASVLGGVIESHSKLVFPRGITAGCYQGK